MPHSGQRVRYGSDEGVVDNYHGVKVSDLYRRLEDPASAEAVAWVDKQNEPADAYLAGSLNREAIEVTDIYTFPFKVMRLRLR